MKNRKGKKQHAGSLNFYRKKDLTYRISSRKNLTQMICITQVKI